MDTISRGGKTTRKEKIAGARHPWDNHHFWVFLLPCNALGMGPGLKIGGSEPGETGGKDMGKDSCVHVGVAEALSS